MSVSASKCSMMNGAAQRHTRRLTRGTSLVLVWLVALVLGCSSSNPQAEEGGQSVGDNQDSRTAESLIKNTDTVSKCPVTGLTFTTTTAKTLDKKRTKR